MGPTGPMGPMGPMRSHWDACMGTHGTLWGGRAQGGPKLGPRVDPWPPSWSPQLHQETQDATPGTATDRHQREHKISCTVFQRYHHTMANHPYTRQMEAGQHRQMEAGQHRFLLATYDIHLHHCIIKITNCVKNIGRETTPPYR